MEQCMMDSRPSHSDMVHTGDFVEGQTPTNGVQYGKLLLCFSTDQAYFLVRIMEQLELPTGEPILNSFECPLLCLSNLIEAVPSTNIKRAVSIVYECGSTCNSRAVTSKSFEREQIDTRRLTYVIIICFA